MSNLVPLLSQLLPYKANVFIDDVGRIFSYLDVTSLCRCARVSRYWKLVALDGSNWQHVDLFSFQTDIEVIEFSL